MKEKLYHELFYILIITSIISILTSNYFSTLTLGLVISKPFIKLKDIAYNKKNKKNQIFILFLLVFIFFIYQNEMVLAVQKNINVTYKTDQADLKQDNQREAPKNQEENQKKIFKEYQLELENTITKWLIGTIVAIIIFSIALHKFIREFFYNCVKNALVHLLSDNDGKAIQEMVDNRIQGFTKNKAEKEKVEKIENKISKIDSDLVIQISRLEEKGVVTEQEIFLAIPPESQEKLKELKQLRKFNKESN